MIVRHLKHLLGAKNSAFREMSAQGNSFVSSGKKILGAGLNYYSLLKLQKGVKPNEPIIFIKPTTSYIQEGESIVIPKGFAVNEEVELGVVIGRKGKHIKEEEVMDYVAGYCVALDMTSTNRVGEARKNGLPWEIGKGFDTACPVSRFIEKREIPDPNNVALWCSVNGTVVQEGNTNDLIFSVPKLISYISQFMTLEPNDLVITGSPPGMGPVQPNDVVEGGIKGVVTFKFPVTAEL